MNRLFVLTLAGFFAGIFPATASNLEPNQNLVLPGGHLVKVLSVSRVEYSKGVMAVMVRYQTTVSVDERKALSEEVDNVWKVIGHDVDRAGVSEAILSSNEVHKGIFLATNRMMNFLFEKGVDGKWTRLDRADFMASR